MASGIYNRFKFNTLSGGMSLYGDTLKVALVSGGHSFDATHNTFSQVSANQISGTGYSAGGATLASKAIVQSGSSSFDAADTSWTTATFTASHAVLYDDTLANDDLICSFDFGGAQTVTAGTFTIQWHASGILTLT